ncbi:cytochrome P450 [Zopfia rhizophila CBS 207.26]|uniref:Cytochrome P450 n=1 Tax=Zopfia rhizophila CBS 207.26 TaxID=1314779 RepID=A0A6A6EV94_9PEZI|nr:cytochrome P450 [Zopfia rhizophila CBS 207.26]
MSTTAIILIILISLTLYRFRNLGSRPKSYPPGPPTLPVIGNLHQMPKQRPHLQFKKWAEEYGPIYSLILGTKVMIVLNSDVAIKDLLDKRSGIYSSRPELYLGQVVSGGLRMLLMVCLPGMNIWRGLMMKVIDMIQEYGETWRMIRRTVHNQLNIRAAKSYIPYQDLENRQMLLGFLERPERWQDHLRRYTNSLTTQMVFGFRTTDLDDPKLHQLFNGFAHFSEIINSPTAAVIDVFPFLKYIPDALLPSKKRARQLHEREAELYVGHWLNVKKDIQNKTAKPCICVDLVQSQSTEGFSDKLAAYISGSLLEAGSDTTNATLVGFVQAMLCFPDVQKKAQEELDGVCGNRFPTMEDEKEMQYIRGCVKESMRWMPTAILGVPHAVIKDDEYMGYRIPKGAGVMWNVWAIHNDEKRFYNPREFDPDRYKTDFQSAAEAALNSDPAQRDHFLFGAGRRVCQGMHIAERSLFLAISRLLWAFEFHKPVNEKGEEITPDPEDLTEGLLVVPRSFPIKVVVRSEERADVVRKEWERIGGLLDEGGQWRKVPEGMVWKEYVPL